MENFCLEIGAKKGTVQSSSNLTPDATQQVSQSFPSSTSRHIRKHDPWPRLLYITEQKVC
ncbi:hypothetical protein PM082_003440 [Marasmius tenuissimus]|nr:hypothetical protein PM082_003440 [Marasmius tenuissimus]